MKKYFKGLAISIFLTTLNAAIAEVQWTAFNDCIGTPANSYVTNYTDYMNYYGQTSGQLIDINGSSNEIMPYVTFSIPAMEEYQPLTASNYGANPDSGTDAWEVFDGIIDFSGTIIQHCSSCDDSCWFVDITFSQLDPTLTYTFIGTAFRNSDYGTSRITDHQILSAETYENTSSNGIYYAQGDMTKLLAGDNSSTGYIVRWENIVPGDDGTFTIHTFPDALSGGEGRHGYPLAGFMLQANSPSYINNPPVVDAGSDQTIALLGGDAITKLSPIISDDSLDTEFTPTVTWQQISGNGNVAFAPDNNTANATIVLPTQGQYTLKITATDDINQSTSDTVNINVILNNSAECPDGDINSDCSVDIEDMEAIAANWLEENSSADINNDNEVNLPDFAEVAEHWQAQSISNVMISEFAAINSYIPFLNSTNIYTRYPWANTSLNNVYPDWIEIYNGSSEIVDLAEWYLTDDKSDLTKWQFPAVDVEVLKLLPGEYIIVFASGKESETFPDNYPFVDAFGCLHTNFSLSPDGEYLALVKPDGQTISHAYDTYPKQYPFTTYGITRKGTTGYLKEATVGEMINNRWTGAVNSEEYLGVTEQVEFNRKHGTYTEAMEVVLSCSTGDVEIRYTTDGTEPTTNSPLYSQAIPVSDTTCLKAKAFKENYLSAPSTTMSYIFLDQVVEQEIPSDSRYILDWGEGYIGDYAMDDDPESLKIIAGNSGYTVDEAKAVIKDALLALPTMSVSTAPENLFGDYGIYNNSLESGIEWERPVSVELFDANLDEEFQINCGIRIQGGSSRNPDKNKHSFSLRFRGGYGYSKLNYKMFDSTALKEFDSLQLRAMYNNSWTHADATQRTRGMMIRDQFIRDCLIDMGDESAGAGRYVHLYLNGLYWGIYNVHERPEASHYAAYFGGDDDFYDALNGGEVNDGTYADWNALRSLIINSDNTSEADWLEIKKRINLERYIDWSIIQQYGGNSDLKDDGNWKVVGGGLFDTPWHYYAWDSERVLESSNPNADSTLNSWPFLGSYLIKFTDFRLMFSDRVNIHVLYDGPLSAEKAQTRWSKRKDQLDLAIIAESARWGDNRRSVPYTRNSEWLSENNRVLGYLYDLPDKMIPFFQNKGWYPMANPLVFYINNIIQHSGEIEINDTLTITNPNSVGVIYYTTDNTDPRESWTGNILGTLYSEGITMDNSTPIKARMYYNEYWGPMLQGCFTVGPVKDGLRISELMYNPLEGETEFIELTNISNLTIGLNGVKFTDGIEFTFGSQTLSPGEYTIVVQNETEFLAAYPDFNGTIAGTYSGSLKNSGETIELTTIDNQIIQQFEYKDSWYEITDGEGFSLTIKSVNADLSSWSLKEGWRPCSTIFGSPGRSDDGEIPESGTIIINEILAHSHDLAPDWIELYNTTSLPVNIGGWYLSDDNDDTASIMKYRIPDGTTIDAESYMVFYQDTSFGSTLNEGCFIPFALSDDGESVYLFSGDDNNLTGYVEEESFQGSLTGESFGRHYTSDGSYDFVTMAVATPGQANSAPKVGPVIISEIMYNPPALNGDSYDKDEYEYIRLMNVSNDIIYFDSYVEHLGSNVSWVITDGIDFTFPKNISLSAGGSIYIAKNIDAFEERYGITLNMTGEYDGKLSNGGEKLQLSMPGEYDDQEQAYIQVDMVEYSDKSPWPESADGDGDALDRINDNEYGNDPINWQGSTPSAI